MKNNQTVKTIMELVLLIHGIGMIGGIYFIFTKESWFSKAMNLEKLPSYLTGFLWILAGVSLVITAWALYRDLGFWSTSAVVALISTILGTVLWVDGVVPGSIFGSVASVTILIYLLIIK